jgi:hypothetical protein
MNILVLNGSPKGELSVTRQYVAYLQKKLSTHTFKIEQVAQRDRGVCGPRRGCGDDFDSLLRPPGAQLPGRHLRGLGNALLWGTLGRDVGPAGGRRSHACVKVVQSPYGLDAVALRRQVSALDSEVKVMYYSDR